MFFSSRHSLNRSRLSVALLMGSVVCLGSEHHAAAAESHSMQKFLELAVDPGWPSTFGVDWERRVRARARVGWFCRQSDGFQWFPTVTNVAPLVNLHLGATATEGQNGNCSASSAADAHWSGDTGNGFSLYVLTSGTAAPATDRCVGTKNRPARATSKARSILKLLFDNYGGDQKVGSVGFAGEWVNDQNTVTKQKSWGKLLKDPIVLRVAGFGPNGPVDQKFPIGSVFSTVRGVGKTSMINDGTSYVTVENAASDMDIRVEVGSAIVDPADHGLIQVTVDNGVVTKRSLTGRFAAVVGVPLLGQSGTHWQATFSLANIDFTIPAGLVFGGTIGLSMEGAGQDDSDEGILNQPCSIVTGLGDGYGDADISLKPATEALLGVEASTSAGSVMQRMYLASASELDFMTVPFYIEGAPENTSPENAYVRVWKFVSGAPTLIAGDLSTPRSFTVDSMETYRVSAGNEGDSLRLLHECNIDLNWVGSIAAGSDVGIEVLFDPAPGFGPVMCPAMPLEAAWGPSSDALMKYDAASQSWQQIHDPLSGKVICAGIQVYGEETGSTCLGDLNDDGVVAGVDLGMLLSSWGSSGPGDLDLDGTVDGADLGMFLAAWGVCP